MSPPTSIQALEDLAKRKGVPLLPIKDGDLKCGWVRTEWGWYVTWEEMEYMKDAR